jgi:rubredoxin
MGGASNAPQSALNNATPFFSGDPFISAYNGQLHVAYGAIDATVWDVWCAPFPSLSSQWNPQRIDNDVRDTTLYAWLQGKSKPQSIVAARIVTFLDSLPAERAGIMPIGYEYREYKNWRGIPKPRRCPFCKQAKAEIRKVRGAFQGVCPSCGAMGPKREDHEAALLAWNGKGVL